MIRMIFCLSALIGVFSSVSFAAVGPDNVRMKCKEIVMSKDVLKLSVSTSVSSQEARKDDSDREVKTVK